MNRGHGGKEIFEGIKNKNQFLDFLGDLSGRLRIRIFSFCNIRGKTLKSKVPGSFKRIAKKQKNKSQYLKFTRIINK
jgi:hypothetical protein